MRRLIIVAVGFLSVAASAFPDPACGRWIPNTNGLSWRLCRDAAGTEYCHLKGGGKIMLVVCPTG